MSDKRRKYMPNPSLKTTTEDAMPWFPDRPKQQITQPSQLPQEELDKILAEDAEKFLRENRQKGGE